MSTFDRLAGFADSITNAKQVDVSTATSQKQAEQGYTPFSLSPDSAYNLQAGRVGNLGTGAFEPNSLQADFTQASPMEIIAKYGTEQGLQIINARANAADAVRTDLSKERTFGQGVWDTTSGVGLGVANTLGGIASLGTGLVNDNAGAAVASGMDWFNDAVHGTQSDALNQTRKVVANQNQISAQENKKIYDQDIKDGKDSIVAGLSRVGRDMYDSVANTLDNGMAASDGLSEGIGSLFTGGPLIKGVAALGRVVMGGEKAARGIALAAEMGSKPARAVQAAAKVAPGAVAIGAMEAGGAYQQTAAEIMKMPHAELLAKSPVYQQHIKDGMSPDEARRQTASESGITAAAIQAPIAAATGPLVSKFELNPLKVSSAIGAASNMGRELVEEGIQSGTGQLAQNYALKQNVDSKQDMLKGVGEQAGLGALYGFGSAGVAQAPHLAVKSAGAGVAPAMRTTMAGLAAAGKVVGAATKPVTDVLVKRGEKLMADNEAASPVADATVAQAAQEATANADTAQATMTEAVDAMDSTPEQKAAAHAYSNDLVNATRFNPEEFANASPEVQAAVQGSTDRVQAIQKLADVVNTTEDPNSMMDAAANMYDMVMSMEEFVNRDPEALANLPKDSPANAVLDQYSGLMANIQNTPKVLRAFRAIHSMIQEQAEQGNLNVTEEVADQNQANNVAMAADVSPEVLNADSVNMVLKHADEGKITLNNRQRAALQSAAAVLQGAREFDAKAQELGLRPQDIVSKQIKTDESRSNEGQYSALQHAKRIRSAYNSGNFDLASAYLNDFMQFAQHMQNKVGALNEHLVSGNADKNKSVHYQALTGSRDWVRSKTGLGVNPYDTKSVKFAQQVGLEAKTVADIANALATAYPELNVSHVDVTSLDSRLDKPAAQVVKDFRQGGLDATQTQPKSEPVNQVDETPAVKQEAKPTVQPKAEPVVEKTAPTVEPSQKPAEVTKPVSEKVDATLTNEATIKQPVEKKEGIEAVYPVHNTDKTPNQFVKAFSLPQEPKTRTIGTESPMKDIGQALSSQARFESFTQNTNQALTSDVSGRYKDLMEHGSDIKNILGERLAKFLSTKDVGKRFAEGTEANRWVGGKLLNIVEADGNTFKFNEQLLETAVLAGLQWRLTANQNAAIKDAKDVAAITGIEQALLPDGLVESFENAQTLVEATNSLAQKIESYWGLKRNSDAPLGYTKGIPMAMATEILSAFLETGDVTETMLDVSEIDPASNKTVGLYSIKKLDDADPINKFPTAIEEAMLLEPEEKMYFGDDVPNVAQTQLRNPAVKNTPEQKAALKAEQATEFRVHEPMVNFYEALGRDNILELMGAGTLNPELLNVNTAKSLEGKNLSVSMAYDSLFGVINQVREQETGLDTPIHYGYNMTRVGRMQMLGKNNPQSSKLVREAILPTFATIDLSNENSQTFSDFQVGLAQALGIKVHNMSREAMADKLTKALEGNLKPAVDMMVEFDKSGHLPGDAVSILSTSLGGDKSFVALMALMEYARYLNAEDKSQFNTPLYVEADGVTNGPINAMVLMTGGKFTADWVRNTAKGGLFFGKPGKTMNEHRSQDDSVDLYEASTNGLKSALQALRQTYSHNPAVANQMNHLSSLMDLFIPDYNITEDGALELKRGIAKNPLTITIYGSGARGIAGKMVSAITDAIYERFSDVLQARADNPDVSPAMAMFGKQAASEADADAMLARFIDNMKALTGTVPVMRKNQINLEQTGNAMSGKIDPQKFTVGGEQLKALQENMLHFFVEPMRTGIQNTVGEGLMFSTENLQKATQIQSLVLQDMFQQGVQEKLAEKAKDPSWKKGDFLTQKELNEIQASLSDLAPMIETGSQTFYIAGSENTDVANQVLATNLDDRMRVPMSVYAPSQAGVAGIPFMTIGTGDGMMMQTLSTMKGAPKNTLKIFDGMNIGINDITDASRKANEAVYTSWQGNPVKNVYDSFAKFMKNVDFSKLSQETKEAIAKSALEYDQREGATDADLRIGSELIERNLRNIALGVDIRHKVMNQVQTTVDQMAAVGAPFNNNGKVSLEGLTVDQQVERLNQLFDAELQARKDKIKAEAAPVKETTSSFDNVGRGLKSGVRQLSNTAINKLVKESDISEEQKSVLTEIQKSLSTKDYKVIFGDVNQIDAYAVEKNLERPAKEDVEAAQSGNVYGWTNFSDKTIYLVSPSVETLVHELVHASTFETVLEHYQGTTNEAVSNIESLMEQFRSLDVSKESPAMREAYVTALETINGHLSNGFIEPALSKAAALNEYMAWGLTNRELIAKQKKTTSLKTMVQSVYEAIKRLVFGRKKAPANGEDMFSGLLFNSAVVMRSQPPVAPVAKETTLFHSKVYGDNDRLTSLGQTFDRVITDYLTTNPVEQQVRKGKVTDAIMNAVKVTKDIQAHGFTMNMQERRMFTNIVAALATEAAIDNNALTRAQEYYTHVTKNLSVESFMADPNSTNPADRYYAQQKFDTITGANNIEFDAQGRSSLLPTFLGLAMVSDEVRAVLADIPVMKQDKKLNNTLDNILTNVGTSAMDSLNKRMAGDTKATNVQEGIDALAQTIMETSLNAQSYYDSIATPTGNAIDRANQYIVDGIENLADKTLDKARDVAATATNPLVKATAHAAQLIAAVATEKNGEKVAQGVMAAMNQGKVWQPFHDLVNDITGRTKSNASVYDMIKAVRSQVQADRQQFREHLPTTIASKFTRKVTPEEWQAMHTGMGKTDLAVLRKSMSLGEIRDLLSSQKIVDKEVNTLESDLQNQAGRNWPLINRKAKQLAQFMINGTVGNNLLRNAEAVSRMLGERTAAKSTVDVAKLDKLITLYALEAMNKADREHLSNLAQNETEGMDFATSYLVGQRVDEVNKASNDSRARLNSYKGYIPTSTKPGVNLIVADDSNFSQLNEQSYTRVGAYQGSSAERGKSRSYYFSPVAARAPYSQGILQNVRDTANGVDLGTGFTMGSMVAGRITDKPSVERISKALARGERGNEPLMPIYDDKGRVVAYEQSIDPNMLSHVAESQNLANSIGVWRGRQVEEAKAQKFNDALIDNLHDMYTKDMADSASNRSQYVNLFADKLDPVTADALRLMNSETRQKAESLFGTDTLMVRRDMLNDALGYRAASVGDAWTGNSRWSAETTDTFKKALLGAFGNKAYKSIMNAENLVQNVVKDAKTLIVVKSVIVPAVNFLANLYQMVGRGVPMKDIAKGIPQKTSEINQYLKTRLRQIDAEAEMRATTNPNQVRKLKAEILSITDSHKRMSIWPLLEAGEFSSIADAGISRDDMLISEGKVHEYMERLTEKLPKSIRAAGRYALITKDTALFQGIQKTVEYSDFIAKAIIYDELTKRKGKSQAEALGRVTEEFINYDRLPGRFRGYMESMGLMWFYNFKIRSAKVAVSMIRNNPVHAAMAVMAPTPTMFGNVGLPIQDNIFSIMAEGNIGYSFGPGQGLRAHNLNPWFNLAF